MKYTIPDEVLEKIIAHRPHLAGIVNNLRSNPARAVQFEKALADAYLMGETRLSPMETWKLSACCVGKMYGGEERVMRNETQYTVAEVRPDGMFPVVFGLIHDVEHPEEACDQTLSAEFYGVHGAGFVCLDQSAAERWAKQIDDQHDDREFCAVPLSEAQDRYRFYRESMAG